MLLALPYMFVSACLCLSLSLSLSLSCSVAVYLSVSYQQTIRKTTPVRVTFRPVKFISATLKSLSVVTSTEVSGSGGFCFYLTCVMSLLRQ